MNLNWIMQIENILFPHMENKSGRATYWRTPAGLHLWSQFGAGYTVERYVESFNTFLQSLILIPYLLFC